MAEIEGGIWGRVVTGMEISYHPVPSSFVPSRHPVPWPCREYLRKPQVKQIFVELRQNIVKLPLNKPQVKSHSSIITIEKISMGRESRSIPVHYAVASGSFRPVGNPR